MCNCILWAVRHDGCHEQMSKINRLQERKKKQRLGLEMILRKTKHPGMYWCDLGKQKLRSENGCQGFCISKHKCVYIFSFFFSCRHSQIPALPFFKPELQRSWPLSLQLLCSLSLLFPTMPYFDICHRLDSSNLLKKIYLINISSVSSVNVVAGASHWFFG